MFHFALFYFVTAARRAEAQRLARIEWEIGLFAELFIKSSRLKWKSILITKCNFLFLQHFRFDIGKLSTDMAAEFSSPFLLSRSICWPRGRRWREKERSVNKLAKSKERNCDENQLKLIAFARLFVRLVVWMHYVLKRMQINGEEPQIYLNYDCTHSFLLSAASVLHPNKSQAQLARSKKHSTEQ